MLSNVTYTVNSSINSILDNLRISCPEVIKKLKIIFFKKICGDSSTNPFGYMKCTFKKENIRKYEDQERNLAFCVLYHGKKNALSCMEKVLGVSRHIISF